MSTYVNILLKQMCEEIEELTKDDSTTIEKLSNTILKEFSPIYTAKILAGAIIHHHKTRTNGKIEIDKRVLDKLHQMIDDNFIEQQIRLRGRPKGATKKLNRTSPFLHDRHEFSCVANEQTELPKLDVSDDDEFIKVEK